MIEGFAFIIIEGKDEGRGEIVSEPTIEFGQIDSGKAGIEVKSESGGVTGLTVGEASELFGIAEEKFNLEPSLVKMKDVEGRQVNIGGEQNEVADFARGAAVNEQGNADFVLGIGHPVNDLGVKIKTRFEFGDVVKAGEVGEGNFAVVFGGSPVAGVGFGVDILQIG